jgi:ANTAR domain
MPRKPRTSQLTGLEGCRQQRSVLAIEEALRGIVRSDEPAVVLSSLARCSSPAFSDGCAIELSEGTLALFQVSFPLPGEARLCAGHADAGAAHAGQTTVVTPFRRPPRHGYPAFAGVAVHAWTGREPGRDGAIIARLLVEHALSIVEQERLARSAARADERAADLAIGLISSRTVGEAIGLLMAGGKATREDAAGVLRQMSRASRRELHEVAADVVRRQAVSDPAISAHPHGAPSAVLRPWHHIEARPDLSGLTGVRRE